MTRAISIACLLVITTSSPALAQRDLSGNWAALYHEDQPHRIPGPDLGDYTGIPLKDDGRLKADSWDASILSLPLYPGLTNEQQDHVVRTIAEFYERPGGPESCR